MRKPLSRIPLWPFGQQGGIASRESVQDEKAKENAKGIALKKTDGGTVTQCIFDYEDGRQVYEIEIINGNIKYEMNVDVQMEHYRLRYETDQNQRQPVKKQ